MRWWFYVCRIHWSCRSHKLESKCASMTYSMRKGKGKGGRGKRKGNRSASLKMLKVHMAGSKRLSTLVFVYEIRIILHSKATLLTPSQSSWDSKGQTEPVLGWVYNRIFARRMFCYEKWALQTDWYLNLSGLQNIVAAHGRPVLSLWSVKLPQQGLLR